ncbi:hypothetical protein MBANPS3_006690 [Mucor bainieri]
MKLSDRKKRVLVNIKQEDQKTEVSLNNACPPVINAPTTSSVAIKEEETKERVKLLQTDDKFGKAGYYYHCDICKRKMANLKSVLEHRQSVRNVKHSNSRKIKFINKEPDVNNPEFYCKSCEVEYKNSKLPFL